MTRAEHLLRHLVRPLLAAGLLFVTTLEAQTVPHPAARAQQLVVTPHGPHDGGDFGPHTPGTKTSGLQEAFAAAKAQGKDLYLSGGSWTADQTEPVVYHLQETLHIPWMQNFRLDSGHCVINYTAKTGDAVVIDSQMSCAYRFGIIVSLSDGAVVRLQPATAGPDRFQVITSTEFTFNALVGGGGAWPGGEPYKNELDPNRTWIGSGLVLDGAPGAIDANKIMAIEIVGCAIGLELRGRTSRNSLEANNIHLCRDHVLIGSPTDAQPCDNRIEAFLDCQGIPRATGVTCGGSRNLLTLSVRPGMAGFDVRLLPSAEQNVVLSHSRLRVQDEAGAARANTFLGAVVTPYGVE